MKLKVYKSLDKSSSLFGIRGSFIRIAGAGAALAVVVGMGVIGPVTDGLVGILSVVALLVVDYMGVMMLQGKYTERGLDRRMSVRSLPRFILTRPRPMRRLLRDAGTREGRD